MAPYWNTNPTEATFAWEQSYPPRYLTTTPYDPVKVHSHWQQFNCLPSFCAAGQGLKVDILLVTKLLYHWLRSPSCCPYTVRSVLPICCTVVQVTKLLFSVLKCLLLIKVFKSEKCVWKITVLLTMVTNSLYPISYCNIGQHLQVAHCILLVSKLLYCWSWSPSHNSFRQGFQDAVLLVMNSKSLPIYFWSMSPSCCNVGKCLQVPILLLMFSSDFSVD